MAYSFTRQEFGWIQCFLNDLYQDYQVRSGPSGPMVERVRSKFLSLGSVDLMDDERRFLFYNVNDVFQSSHSPVVKPQISLQVSYVGEQETKGGAELRYVRSQISQLTNTSGNAEIEPQYLPTWNVMQSIMTKLGQAPIPPYTGENTAANVDRSAEMNGPEPNIDPDDRMMFESDNERSL